MNDGGFVEWLVTRIGAICLGILLLFVLGAYSSCSQDTAPITSDGNSHD